MYKSLSKHTSSASSARFTSGVFRQSKAFSPLRREQIFPVCLPEIYTIQGNSHGHPCYFPFLYDGQWFHNCTSTGREDGHLWCATTADYGKDERWGFCPVKSERRFPALLHRLP